MKKIDLSTPANQETISVPTPTRLAVVGNDIAVVGNRDSDIYRIDGTDVTTIVSDRDFISDIVADGSSDIAWAEPDADQVFSTREETVLSADLKSFSAKKKGGDDVTVTLVVSNEDAGEVYEFKKSLDGGHTRTTIHTATATGTDKGDVTYTFIDEDANSHLDDGKDGYALYFVDKKDLSGKTKVFTPSVKVNMTGNDLKHAASPYPNPPQDNTFLLKNTAFSAASSQQPEDGKTQRYPLYDQMGRLAREFRVKANEKVHQFNTYGLPSGTYFLGDPDTKSVYPIFIPGQ